MLLYIGVTNFGALGPMPPSTSETHKLSFYTT